MGVPLKTEFFSAEFLEEEYGCRRRNDAQRDDFLPVHDGNIRRMFLRANGIFCKQRS